jgi:hypothetical protein
MLRFFLFLVNQKVAPLIFALSILLNSASLLQCSPGIINELGNNYERIEVLYMVPEKVGTFDDNLWGVVVQVVEALLMSCQLSLR